MHSRPGILVERGRIASLPVSASQVIDCLLHSGLDCHVPSPCSGKWPTTRSRRVSLTHRFIHTPVAVLREFWKMNHLARNSELDVMIQNTTTCISSHVRDRWRRAGRG
jgi:hypothetical protein